MFLSPTKKEKPAPNERISTGAFDFELQRKRVKNINLRVNRDGDVIVSAPYTVSRSFVTQFVISKTHWVTQRRKEICSNNEYVSPKFDENAEHYLWGRAYPVTLSQARKTTCTFANDQFHFSQPDVNADNTDLQKHLDNWYRIQIKAAIPPLLKKWQGIVGVEAKDWGVKKMRTKWGTCNIQAARIWLNLELIKYPPECLEYVIVHELTHLHERHHNKRFYSLMGTYLADWREREQLLETFFQY